MSASSRAASQPLATDVKEAQVEIWRSRSQQYRPDVDGLRAVAALAVLAVHAGLLRGGFFGVDIFFVISGFLISGIIFRALHDGQFRLLDFYARRVNRIFPALIVLLTSVCVFGLVFVPPAERHNLGEAVAAGAGFAENLWTYANQQQLSSPLDYMLGHLWTLGVEEQFYLVWPLLLITMWFLLQRRWRFWIIAAATVWSFGSYIWTVSDLRQWLLPWTRFWELAAGAILACFQHVQNSETRVKLGSLLRLRLGHTLGTIGSVCIIVALVGPQFFSEWPPGHAWLPVLGTFLVISAGPDQWINRRVLAARPMVFIGLISYPLYLWHWSLFMAAFFLRGHASAFEHDPLPVIDKAVVIAASFVLSYVTYRYIELPLRSSRNTGGIARQLCIAMAVCGMAAYFVL